LRRRLDSLKRLAEHPATPAHEADAAARAIPRLLGRLGEDAERLVEREPPYVAPRQKRAKPAERPIYVGDVIDCDASEGLWARCRNCGSTRFEVVGAQLNGYCGLLVCVGCKRGGRRWLTREHFMAGGRSLD
jgi:hypothetical protein